MNKKCENQYKIKNQSRNCFIDSNLDYHINKNNKNKKRKDDDSSQPRNK